MENNHYLCVRQNTKIFKSKLTGLRYCENCLGKFPPGFVIFEEKFDEHYLVKKR